MRCWTLPLFAIGVLASGWASAALPEIDRVAPERRPPSGRLLIVGSDFGDGIDGQVSVGGLPAIVTQWSETKIHAYVPEGVAPGMVDVEVVRGGEVSAPSSVEVVPRSSQGRRLWFFEMDRWDTRQFVAVGPDGTVYTSDALGLYALSPEGALLWFAPGIGGGRPIEVAPDGTIYAAAVLGLGTAGNIYALNPDGTIRWEFDAPTFFLDTVTGPGLGPDGNIYAYQDFSLDEGLGFFSLTPDGDLRWSDRGDPELTPVSDISNSEIVFADDRFYAGLVNIGSGGQPVTYAYSFDGDQLWFTGNSDLDARFQSFPRADPQGRSVGAWGQTGIITLAPGGETEWITRHPSQINVEDPMAIDSEGNVYVGVARAEMWSLAPDGEIRWVLPTNFDIAFLSKVGISPDDRILIAHKAEIGAPTAISAHAPDDGRELWQIDFPNRGGLMQQVTTPLPRFSADSSTVYITTSSGGPSFDYSRIYAIDVREERPTTDGAGAW